MNTSPKGTQWNECAGFEKMASDKHPSSLLTLHC